VMGPPLVVLGSGLEQWGRQLLLLGRSFATAASLACKTVMGPPMVLLLAAMQAFAQFMLPIWQVGPMPCLGPIEKLPCSCSKLLALAPMASGICVCVAVCCPATVQVRQLLLV